MSNLEKNIRESCKAKEDLIFSKEKKNINKAIKIIYSTIKKGKKLLICGNGGSASDAKHMSTELLVRLRPKINRKPIPAISLTMDTTTLTACGNDYGFEYIFSRSFKALASKGDLLFTISTSGNSKNVYNVLKESKKMKIFSISLLGKKSGSCKNLSNLEIKVNSKTTARIQETHIFIIHHILESVEDLLIKNAK